MTRLTQTLGLTEVQAESVSIVKRFVEEQFIPSARELEQSDTYPQVFVDRMRDIVLFGLMIPAEYGELGESLLTYALCAEELGRGWMSISAAINTHFIGAYMIRRHGTDGQKQRFLPRMATGEIRGAFSVSEPEVGSDVAARACGVGIRAFEPAVRYAQQRWTCGKPIVGYQAIVFQLAEMATRVEAAHLMMVNAARRTDSGQRNDIEAGMANYPAGEFDVEVAQQSCRIHGGHGYSREYEIERLMRDAPFLLIGEGTGEIQKTIISKRLLAEYRI